MEDYITRNEHKAFADRIDAENKRQNHRIDALEEEIKEIRKMNVQLAEMAQSLKQMAAELSKQGERLEAIEREPAQKWKNAVWIVVAGLIGASLSLFLSRVGL